MPWAASSIAREFENLFRLNSTFVRALPGNKRFPRAICTSHLLANQKDYAVELQREIASQLREQILERERVTELKELVRNQG